MSRDRSTIEEDVSRKERTRIKELFKMVREGRSFSGYEKNCCFLNIGTLDGEQFANVSGISGLDYPDDGRAVSVLDWDHDGDLDLWIRNRNAPRMRFCRNEVGRATGEFIALKLVGNGASTNRDAIGARVEVVVRKESQKKLIKTLRAGESFLSQNSKWLHFGLGSDYGGIEKVVIRWPDSTRMVEELTDLQPNRRYVITQKQGWTVSPSRDPDVLAIEPGTPRVRGPESSLRIPPVSLVLAPKVRGRDYTGKELVTDSIGRWMLINIWASWCAPCVAELKSFVDRADEIKEAGIRVIALTADGEGNDQRDPQLTLPLLQRIRFPFEAGIAQEQMLNELKEATDYLTSANEPLSLPMSFLVDPENRIAVIYRGQINIDDLLDDASSADRTRVDRWKRTAPFGGRTIDHQHIRDTSDSLEATLMYRLGRRYQDSNHNEMALYYFQQAVKVWPDFQDAQRHIRMLMYD